MRDAALAVLLFATITSYLAVLPLSLGNPDEGHMLHEAKRLLDGEVMYRDVFDLATPGWVYLMAGLFRAFGTTLATARLTAGVIDGGIAAMIFVACRWLGVRRLLAWVCGFAYFVVCQPLFAVASYHWLATFLSVALFLLCLRSTGSTRWAFALGVAVGLVVMVHQQRGMSIGLAVPAFFVAEALIRLRHGASPRWSALWRELGAFSGGLLLVVGLVLGTVVVRAGMQPVWDALVKQPLINYRTAIWCPWGFEWGGGRSLIGGVLKYAPVVMVPTVAMLLTLCWAGRSGERVRVLALLTLFCAFSILSIAYYPDIIHIALIAPFFFIALADTVEEVLHLLPARLHGAVAAAVGVAVVFAGGVRLYTRRVHLREQYPVAYQSAFGRVDLSGARQTAIFDQLRALLDAEPVRLLYSYPFAGYTHLLVDARNPSRFEFVLPGSYTSPEQVQEVVDTLAASRAPYVLGGPALVAADDPLARFIRAHYERARTPMPLASSLWRLKDS